MLEGIKVEDWELEKVTLNELVIEDDITVSEDIKSLAPRT